ncbi:hypothetical protein HD554DRAFT_565537 [Boletus coccyginus]|nr:hypothetical protein HD554DRAFT_565537 [Boletus coccyginus]
MGPTGPGLLCHCQSLLYHRIGLERGSANLQHTMFPPRLQEINAHLAFPAVRLLLARRLLHGIGAYGPFTLAYITGLHPWVHHPTSIRSTLWTRKVLLALTMDNRNVYNRDFPPKAILDFNKNVFNEKEVICLCVDNGTLCNDLVKVKDLGDHLHDRHGVTSDLPLYACQWYECPSSHPMRRSSLARHMKEQHVPFRWLCPYCGDTFTRESSLLTHIERSPTGHE